MIINDLGDLAKLKDAYENGIDKTNETNVVEDAKVIIEHKLPWWVNAIGVFMILWLGCITYCIVILYESTPNAVKTTEYDLGEYVYLDKEKRIWHSSLECSKLNRATSKSGVIRETPKGAVIYDSHQFCFECVKDDVYNKWMELRKPAVLIDTIIYED